MQIWMMLDPETRRVSVQTWPVTRGDRPRGLRGEGWLVRIHEVNGSLLTSMLNAGVKPDTQDRLHRGWWDDARAEGEPLWPLLPGETEWPPSR